MLRQILQPCRNHRAHDALSRTLTQWRPTQKHSSEDVVRLGATADLSVVSMEASAKRNHLNYIRNLYWACDLWFWHIYAIRETEQLCLKVVGTLEIHSLTSLYSSPVFQCVVRWNWTLKVPIQLDITKELKNGIHRLDISYLYFGNNIHTAHSTRHWQNYKLKITRQIKYQELWWEQELKW